LGYHVPQLCLYCTRHSSSTSSRRDIPHAFFFLHSAVEVNPRPRSIPRRGARSYTWENIPSLKEDFSDALVGDPVDWFFPSSAASASNRPLPYWLPYIAPQHYFSPEERREADSIARARRYLGQDEGLQRSNRTNRRRPRVELTDDDEDESPEERRAADDGWRRISTQRRVRRKLASDLPSNWNDINGHEIYHWLGDRVRYGMLDPDQNQLLERGRPIQEIEFAER